MSGIILKKKAGVKWFTIIAAAAVTITAVNINTAPEVGAEEVKQGNIRGIVELQGLVELENKETVFARVPGFVDEISAGEGDIVDENTKLLQLSVEDLDFAIDKAQSAYDASRANLAELKKSIKPEHLKLAEAQLEQAEASYTAALKDYEYMNENLDKMKVLLKSSAISEKELKEAETMLAAAESRLKNAEQGVNIAQYNLSIISKGVSEEAVKGAEANMQAARIQLEELISNKGKARVFSPIKGIVLAKKIEKGTAVQAGTPLYEIGDYQSAYISADVLIDDISKIKKGQKAIISGAAAEDIEIPGEVYYIAPKAESSVSSLGVQQQRIEVRIKFDSSRFELRPGYSLDVDIITDERQSAVYVPDKAIFELNGEDTVFVVRNNKLELRKIKCGIENDDFTEIVSGLKSGELVVMNPENKLKPGKKVRIINNGI